MSTLGAIVAVLVMALAPASAAATGALSFKHATSLIDVSSDSQGCASASNPVHSFKLKTGVGAISQKESATTCSASKGGLTTDSNAGSFDEIGITQNYASLTHNYSYLNSTWSVNALTTLSASGKIKNCPYQNESFVDYFYNGTGFSYGYVNETYQNCYAEAYVYVDPEMLIDDYTTGQYWGFGFSGYYAYAGEYADNFSETINYTTAGWTNYSYACTTCYGSYGPGGTTAVSTTVYGNVTGSTYGLLWSKGDHVEIYAEIFVETGVELYYAKAGKASASIDAAGPRGHVDLTAFSFT